MIRLLRKICTFLGDRADVNSGDVWNVYTFSVIQNQLAGHDASSQRLGRSHLQHERQHCRI